MEKKKNHTIAPKKSDAKKKKEADSKTKASPTKRINKKKTNEFGDEDAF